MIIFPNLALIVFCFCHCIAQEPQIPREYGVVIEVIDHNDLPIYGAKVTIIGIGSQFTNQSGEVLFTEVREGEIDVTVVDHRFTRFEGQYVVESNPLRNRFKAEMSTRKLQGFTFYGRIFDQDTGDPILNASVTLRAIGEVIIKEAVVQKDGYYRLKLTDDRLYVGQDIELTCSSQSYTLQRINLRLDKKNNLKDFKLARTSGKSGITLNIIPPMEMGEQIYAKPSKKYELVKIRNPSGIQMKNYYMLEFLEEFSFPDTVKIIRTQRGIFKKQDSVNLVITPEIIENEEVFVEMFTETANYRKLYSSFSITLEASVGGRFGQESLLAENLNSLKKREAVFGGNGKIGLSFNWKIRRYHKQNLSLYFSILDFGNFTLYRANNQMLRQTAQINLENLLSPGIFFLFTFSDGKYSIGPGIQLGPLRPLDSSYQTFSNTRGILLSIGTNLPVLQLLSR